MRPEDLAGEVRRLQEKERLLRDESLADIDVVVNLGAESARRCQSGSRYEAFLEGAAYVMELLANYGEADMKRIIDEYKKSL